MGIIDRVYCALMAVLLPILFVGIVYHVLRLFGAVSLPCP